MRPALNLSLGAALALPCAPAIVASDSMQQVPISGYMVEPAGDLQLDENRFEVHPMSLLGVGYDSNVDPVENRGGDVFARAIAGMVLRYLPNPQMEDQADGEIEQLHYARLRDLDATIGRIRLRSDYEGPLLKAEWTGSWIRTEDPIIITGETVLLNDYQTALTARHSSALWWEEATLGWEYLSYENATSLFSNHEADHDSWTAGERVGIGDPEDQIWVASRAEFVEYANDDLFNDCHALSGTLGRDWALGARTLAHVEAGADYRYYNDDFDHDPAYNDRSVIWPIATISCDWRFEERSDLSLQAFSSVTDGLASNYETHRGGGASFTLRLLRQMSLVGHASVSLDRNSGAPQDQTPIQRVVERGDVELLYALPKGFTLCSRLEGWRSIGYSYERWRTSVDVAYAY